MRRFGWLIVAAWPLAAMAQAPAPDVAAVPDTLASIKAEAERARESFREELDAASTDEMRAAVDAFHARWLGLMDRALTLARSRPKVAEADAAAAWVAVMAPFEAGDDAAERGDAAYRLLADSPALDDPELLGNVPEIFTAIAAAWSDDSRVTEAEPFLRALIARGRDRALVHLARLYLGLRLAEVARLHDRLKAPVSGPELVSQPSKTSLERSRGVDGPKLRGEAEALFRRVISDEAEVGLGLRGTAEDAIYRIQHLRIGQPAPELAGADIDGEPIRLIDFRGKVVVLLFWSSSSISDKKWISRQKDLIAAMRGRPFALVGVNVDADEDRAKVKEEVAKEGISWRSLWTGGPDEEIPRRWSAGRFPLTYLIDDHGIIMDDQVGENLSPAALQSLVQAVEEAAR